MRKIIGWPAATLLSGILLLCGSCQDRPPSSRETLNFNSTWKFELDDSPDYKLAEYDDTLWRKLDLPHDWSIEGKFDKNSPAGLGGGFLQGRIGWYRKTFTLPESDSVKKIYIAFDGVYHNSEVYVNGTLLGKRPNGYISFQYDLTPFLKFGKQNRNVISVRVDNSDQPNSRWYTGSGIYRNTWLVKTHPVHVNIWGMHITTPTVSEKEAEVEISVSIINTTASGETVEVETRIVDRKLKTVAKSLTELEISGNSTEEVQQKLTVSHPSLWSIKDPYLYKAVSYIRLKNRIIDISETSFGIRYFEFDPDHGFSLNGQATKILGVCNHHDIGALGAVVNRRAIERQLEILKAMGCNAIRTSHNPPCPELLDLCDRMGFIVMNETFDTWGKKKVTYDYDQYWDEWHTRDLTDHLLRDRNHPSVFIWSIGNEILEQFDSSGTEITRELAALVHKMAPGVPVTSGCNFPEPGNFIIRSGALDLIGVNYHHETFEEFPEKFKGQIFVGSETGSALSSRGCYDMPSDSVRIWPVRWDEPFFAGNPDQTCSAYDNCHVPWGSTHEETWELIKSHDYLSGLFIWTGFDYLGEPTPYQWPSRSSYFGIVDLAGFPKDAYYFYQSEWTTRPVLHLFPHWNWEEGQVIDIWAYTNFSEVELFINGKSRGRQTRQEGFLHLAWRVPFEPGTLKAIGRNPDGKTCEAIINTAGKPSKIRLDADRSTIQADGSDLAFITVTLLDRDNNPVPRADNRVFFEVGDLVALAAVDNGCQTSLEPFLADSRKAFNGKCLAVLRSGTRKGRTWIKASSEGLQSAILKLNLI